MARITITQACGHKRVVAVSGTAASKSAQVFELAMANCPKCECPTCGEALNPEEEGFCENCFQNFPLHIVH